ncbi:MAG: 50S ribosomal protein L16, partial [Treponema sp.]|nr:50S ribosomal protein L16 [Treponema sp.]
GRVKGEATRCNSIDFGEYALVSLEPFWLTNRQLEAARVALNRKIKRGGKVWIRVFPDKPISKKPAETRMGKGKGAPEFWAAVIKPGMILFEVGGVDLKLAHRALELAQSKLPITSKIAYKPTIA